MKELLFALSIFGSFMYGFAAIGKLVRNQAISSGYMMIFSTFVTAMITHILGMW